MFRFTIREIVLLTVIVSLCVAWWLDHSQLRQLWLNAKHLGEHDHWAAEAFTYVTRSNSRHGTILMTRDSPTRITVTDHSPDADYSGVYDFPDMPHLPGYAP